MTLTIYAELEQGSQEWLEARRGLLTASTAGKLIVKSSPDALTVECPRCQALANEPCTSAARKIPTPIKTVHDERTAVVAGLPDVYEVADNETSRALTLTLAAERITGHVDYVHPNADMQRGTDDEPVARAVYAEHYAPVEEVGFIVREEAGYRLGYSPDGLVGEVGLIEIKSRRPDKQLATVLSGRPPAYNMAQMQAGMFITGRDWCDYVSFSAGLPLWVKRVYWDGEWFAAIEAAAKTFEINVTNVVNNFLVATDGLPATERRPELEEIRFS